MSLAANAGPDQAVGTYVPVILDGSASTGATTYFWKQTSGSPFLDFVGFDRVNPVVIGTTTAGTYVFTLEVGDGLTTSTDTMTITITNPTGVVRYVDNLLAADTTTYSIANRNSSGTDGNGYKTAQSAANAVAAGDTVYFRAGTYTDVFTVITTNVMKVTTPGTVTQPIRFQNYNNEAVIIRGAGSFSDLDLNSNGWADGVAHSSFRETLIELDGDYLQFVGFELTNSEQVAININGNFTYVAELYIHDIWYTGLYYDVLTAVTRQGNVARWCLSGYTRHGYGSIAQTSSTTPMRWKHNVTADCFFYQNGHEANGQKVLPASSTDHGIISDSQGGGNGGGCEQTKQFYDPNPTDNHGVNNYMVRCVAYRCTDDGYATSTDDLLMEDCYSLANGPCGGNGVKYYKPGKNTVSRGMVSYANLHRGWEIRGATGTHPFEHYNCTAIRNWQNGAWADGTAYDLRNNVCAFNVLSDYFTGIVGGGLSTNNWAGDGTGNVGFSGDPQVVNNNVWGPTLVAGRVDPFAPGNAGNNSSDYPSDFMPINWPVGSTNKQKVEFVRNQIEAALKPFTGSPLINAGVIIPGYHCPTADDDPITPADPHDPRKHWWGSAPDIGAFQFNPNLGTGSFISLLSIGLDFGSVVVGTSVTGTLRISNTGDADLNVSSITYPNAVFTGAFSGTITAGSSQDVTVTFLPVTTILYSGNITVNSDAGGGTNTIGCSGTGVTAGGGQGKSKKKRKNVLIQKVR